MSPLELLREVVRETNPAANFPPGLIRKVSMDAMFDIAYGPIKFFDKSYFNTTHRPIHLNHDPTPTGR